MLQCPEATLLGDDAAAGKVSPGTAIVVQSKKKEPTVHEERPGKALPLSPHCECLPNTPRHPCFKGILTADLS